MDDSLETTVELECPKCSEKAKPELKPEFDKFFLYLSHVCSNCNYKVFEKKNFMSCGAWNI